jgi:uncharacterized membrane protein
MAILNALSEIVAYQKQRSHRIEALADGVFAIVMTLLVLDVRIPIKDIHTETGLLTSLVHTLPKILTFVLSFTVAGQFWSTFINQFNYIHTSDRNENIIALFYLMFVSLIPFSTSFLSEHLWSRVAIGFYILNILVILLFQILHWLYSYKAGLMKSEGGHDLIIHKAMMARGKTALIAYILVVGCCFFNSYLALYVTFLVHIIFLFSGFIETANRRWRRKVTRSVNHPLFSKPHPNEGIKHLLKIRKPQ